MSDLSLETITSDNWRLISSLDAGDNHQFVEPPTMVMLDILFRFRDGFTEFAKAICFNQRPIGFVAFFPTESNKNTIFVHTFLLDHSVQGRGLGNRAFGLTLQHIHSRFHPKRIELSSNNPTALRLYAKFGFAAPNDETSRSYFEKYNETLMVWTE